MFLRLQYNAKTAKDMGPLKLKAIAFRIDSPGGTWVNMIPIDKNRMYINSDIDIFPLIGPKNIPRRENKINPYLPISYKIAPSVILIKISAPTK